MTERELKLIALDLDDLAVVSAQLQDAVVRVGDMSYDRAGRRFAAIVNRFNWMHALSAEIGGRPKDKPFERRQTALRFERVRRASLQGIDLKEARRVLSLLAITFEAEAADEPSGTVTLIFAAGAAIRLDVDYIECEVRDLGAVWGTRARPTHGTDDDGTV